MFFKSKNTYRTTIRYLHTPIRIAKKKKLRAAEDVEKLDLSYIVGRGV